MAQATASILDSTLASFRCGAKVQTLLEVKRTCRDRRRRRAVVPGSAKIARNSHGWFQTFPRDRANTSWESNATVRHTTALAPRATAIVCAKRS